MYKKILVLVLILLPISAFAKWNVTDKVHISEHSDQSFRDYPITHFGLNRSLISRLSDHF